jgi:hypothetical protein
MARMIELPEMTEQQMGWLRELLAEASADALGSASNYHKFALGAKHQVDSVEFEKSADNQREYAQILLNIAAKI